MNLDSLAQLRTLLSADGAPVIATVVGAPGTGKTTAALRLVDDHASAGRSLDSTLVLSPSRVLAGRLRTRLSQQTPGTHIEPLVRTPSSLAFAILRAAAAEVGEAEPRLMTGPEQDGILRDLLVGHASGEVEGPLWPSDVEGALATQGFRDQLRDLLMRAVELGVSGDELARLGRVHNREVWVAASEVLDEYDSVTALASPGSFDPAWIGVAAAQALEDNSELHRKIAGSLSLLVVDDAQELTASAARLIQALHHAGMSVVFLGDGDAVVQGFRGAAPERFRALADDLHRASVRSERAALVMTQSHRYPRQMTDVMSRVSARIGVSGESRQRDVAPVAAEPNTAEPTTEEPMAMISAVALHTAAQEAAYVAQAMRRAHLTEGIPWSQMAVIARSGSQHEAIRRAFAGASVPVAMTRPGVPLRQDPATRPLLMAFQVVLRIADGLAPALSVDEAVELVTSPLGGADPVQLRRLRRALRARGAEEMTPIASAFARSERAGADEVVPAGDEVLPTSDELIRAALLEPQWLRDPEVADDADLEPVRRVAHVLSGASEALKSRRSAPKKRGLNAHQLLWEIWSRSGLAAGWEAQALAGGAAGLRADRALDAVLVLFGAAEDFTSRLRRTEPRSFLNHMASQDLAPDTLVAREQSRDAVEVLTPFTAAGREWAFVAVVGLQEGVWPDLRLRDTLLGAQSLVEVMRGRPIAGVEGVRAAQSQVRSDELRQFYVAVSRATSRLLVTAVTSTDEQPSAFMNLVVPEFNPSEVQSVPAAPTLRTLVASTRRGLVTAHQAGQIQTRDQHADLLDWLAQRGVGGADVDQWWDARVPSSTTPRIPEGQVKVSPSKIEEFNQCSLRWLLKAHGGDAEGALSAARGTLVHSIVADSPQGSIAEFNETLSKRWSELRLANSWVSARGYRQAEDMLRRYVGYRDSNARQLVAVEISGRADVGRARLSGQVDRLERDADGGFVVIDLKTGASAPSKVDLLRHPQLGAYQVALEHGAFRDETGAEPMSAGSALVQIGGTRIKALSQPQVALSMDDEPDWAENLVRDTADGMAGDRFPAKVGSHCNTCPVRLACPAQPEGDRE